MQPEEIVIYKDFENSDFNMEVRIEEESAWLNRLQLAQLFDRNVKTIGKYLSNALKEELKGIQVVAKFATTAKLRKPHSSIPANPLLAEPMYLAGFIERMGTGTVDIIRLCEEAGLKKAPEFLQEEIFKTILWRKNEEDIEGGSPDVGVNVGVNAILMFIENNPGINVLTMAKDFNVSQRTIERWINQLKKENKIEFIGASKTGGYNKINTK